MTTRTLPVIEEEEPLPPFYQSLLRQVLPGPIPREVRATCSSCAMIPEADPPKPDTPAYSFHSLTKCCTYLPEIPNFLVGAILASTDPEEEFGQLTVTNRIEYGGGVSLTGLLRTSMYEVAYRHASDGGAFGRSPALRCPHYVEESGGCGIWQYRNSVCSTWFCKHVRGSVGHAFWSSVKDFLSAVEDELALYCALEAGAQPEQLSQVLELQRIGAGKRIAEELVAEKHDRLVKEIWLDLHGKQLDFFRRCFDIARSTQWGEFRAQCGQNVRIRERTMYSAYERLVMCRLPETGKYSGAPARSVGNDWYQITTFNGHDPIAIPTDVWLHLPQFDGRSLEEILASLPESVSMALKTSNLLLRLFDHKVLLA